MLYEVITKRKRLLLIKQKHLRLFIGAAIVLAVFVILSVILSATGHEAKKQSAVNNMKSTGLINIGLRGDIGKLCTFNEDTGKFEGFEKDVADEIVSRLFGSDIFVNYVLRITSYNVCYTKLLRAHRAARAAFRQAFREE